MTESMNIVTPPHPDATHPPLSSAYDETIGVVGHTAHMAPVLRALSLGATRPKQVRKSLPKLKDAQIHRVLNRALGLGLVWRRSHRREAHYELTPLGRSILKTTAAPGWLPIAELVTRALVRARLTQASVGSVVSELLPLLQLPKDQLTALVQGLKRSLNPGLESLLYRHLRARSSAIVFMPVVYHKPLENETDTGQSTLVKDRSRRGLRGAERYYAPRLDSLAEHNIKTAIEASGDEIRVRELLPTAYAAELGKAARPQFLPSGPIVSLSSPLVSPVTLGLLIEYGCSVRWDFAVERRLEVLAKDASTAHKFSLADDKDYGAIIRIAHPSDGVSHFIVAGFKPTGTLAASEYFRHHIERVLRKYPTDSFAVVLEVSRKTTESGRVVFTDRIVSSDPEGTRIDMRFVDAYAFIAEEVQRLAARRTDGVLRLLPKTLLPNELARGVARTLGAGKTGEQDFLNQLARAARTRLGNVAKARRSRPTIDDVLERLNLASYTRLAVIKLAEKHRLKKHFVHIATEAAAGSNRQEGIHHGETIAFSSDSLSRALVSLCRTHR